jgi:hypothetical protein
LLTDLARYAHVGITVALDLLHLFGSFALWVFEVFLDRLLALSPAQGEVAIASGVLRDLDPTKVLLVL